MTRQYCCFVLQMRRTLLVSKIRESHIAHGNDRRAHIVELQVFASRASRDSTHCSSTVTSLLRVDSVRVTARKLWSIQIDYGHAESEDRSPIFARKELHTSNKLPFGGLTSANLFAFLAARNPIHQFLTSLLCHRG